MPCKAGIVFSVCSCVSVWTRTEQAAARLNWQYSYISIVCDNLQTQ